MRALQVLADEPATVLEALRETLSAEGPALLPLAPGASRAGLPLEVHKRVAVVVQTSGTAGAPKRVALSADALLASAAASQAALGEPGTWVLALPVHYIAGLQVLVRAIATGSEPVLLPPGRFDPRAFAAAVSGATGPVYTSLVPAQLATLLGSSDPLVVAALPRVAAALVGGQRLQSGLAGAAAAAALRVVRTYGASETSGGCVYDGVPLAGTITRIVDGEVQLSGPMLAEGYLDDPERTAYSFVHGDGHRWFRTGDAGNLEDGVLSVTRRLDDVIVSGGEKVSLGLVETVVRELPGLADAVVVRGPSARWGEVPVVATTTADRPGLLDAVRAAVEERLGAPARPESVVTVDPLPFLASGKPDRARITALVAERAAR